MAPDEWIAIGTWLTGIGTLLVALVAAFQDKIRSWISKPKLSISITLAPPDCHKVPLRYGIQTSLTDLTTCDCYYFRLRVKNEGDRPAEHVEVFAEALSVKGAGGNYVLQTSFLPLNLKWSHTHEVYFPRISRDIPKYCDLGHIIDPTHRARIAAEDNPDLGVPAGKALFSFDTIVQSNTLSHLIAPGTYRLTVVVGAANARPVRQTLEISFTGNWFSDETKMLQKEIDIKIVE